MKGRYFYYNDMVFVIPDDVYYPREDTLLFCDFLSKNLAHSQFEKILDMGCGCGILGILTSKILNKTVICCDINESAINASLFNANLNKARIKAIKSDLFSNLNNTKFDLIIFNPPYLPPAKEDLLVDEKKRITWCGGIKLIYRFLSEAYDHLTENGKIQLLYSTLTGKINFEKYGFNSKIMMKEKLSWEELIIVELWKS
jgi:release factor glutamine methyltransferase